MEIEKHLEKGTRFERTADHLDPREDYEAIIWARMHACTHWLNAAFHAKKLTRADLDFEHTWYLEKIPDQDRLREELDGELCGVLSALTVFEGLRATHVRGPGPYGPAITEMSKEAFDRIKRFALKATGAF